MDVEEVLRGVNLHEPRGIYSEAARGVYRDLLRDGKFSIGDVNNYLNDTDIRTIMCSILALEEECRLQNVPPKEIPKEAALQLQTYLIIEADLTDIEKKDVMRLMNFETITKIKSRYKHRLYNLIRSEIQSRNPGLPQSQIDSKAELRFKDSYSLLIKLIKRRKPSLPDYTGMFRDLEEEPLEDGALTPRADFAKSFVLTEDIPPYELRRVLNKRLGQIPGMLESMFYVLQTELPEETPKRYRDLARDGLYTNAVFFRGITREKPLSDVNEDAKNRLRDALKELMREYYEHHGHGRIFLDFEIAEKLLDTRAVIREYDEELERMEFYDPAFEIKLPADDNKITPPSKDYSQVILYH